MFIFNEFLKKFHSRIAAEDTACFVRVSLVGIRTAEACNIPGERDLFYALSRSLSFTNRYKSSLWNCSTATSSFSFSSFSDISFRCCCNLSICLSNPGLILFLISCEKLLTSTDPFCFFLALEVRISLVLIFLTGDYDPILKLRLAIDTAFRRPR